MAFKHRLVMINDEQPINFKATQLPAIATIDDVLFLHDDETISPSSIWRTSFFNRFPFSLLLVRSHSHHDDVVVP